MTANGNLLTFDNVRPATLTLADLLGERVMVQFFEGGADVSPVPAPGPPQRLPGRP